MDFNFSDHPLACSKAVCSAYPGPNFHLFSESVVSLGRSGHYDDEVGGTWCVTLTFLYCSEMVGMRWRMTFLFCYLFIIYFCFFLTELNCIMILFHFISLYLHFLSSYFKQVLESVRFRSSSDNHNYAYSGDLYHLQVNNLLRSCPMWTFLYFSDLILIYTYISKEPYVSILFLQCCRNGTYNNYVSFFLLNLSKDTHFLCILLSFLPMNWGAMSTKGTCI